MSIIIDEEFKSLIPPLSDDEFRQLEANCVRDGIRDPLVVWPQDDSNDILVDGHNRFRISAMHSGIRFDIKRMEFKDRYEAKLWIINNQLGKRNLIQYDKIRLEDQKRQILAEQAKKRQGARNDLNIDKKSCQRSEKEKNKIDRQNKTDYKIAKAAGTSEDTVRKVRTINEKGSPALVEDVRNGDLTINKAYQIVTGTVSKSPKKAMDEFVQSRREAHEEYKRQKEGAVVGLRDAAEDRRNMEVLTNDFHRKFLRISRPVFDIYFEMQNTEGIDDVLRALTPKQRNEMRQTLKHTTAQLALIERRLIESESNLSGSDRAGRTH